MIRVTLILLNRNNKHHLGGRTIGAAVLNTKSNETLYVHFPKAVNGKVYDEKSVEKPPNYFERENHWWCTGVTTLYCKDGNFEQFVKDYHARFPWTSSETSNRKEYDFFDNNCATAVNFTLDYFFKKECALKTFFCIYQSLCCFLTIGCCGFTCCPMPPCIDTPTEVYDKARLLSVRYGKVVEESHPEKKCSVSSVEMRIS